MSKSVRININNRAIFKVGLSWLWWMEDDENFRYNMALGAYGVNHDIFRGVGLVIGPLFMSLLFARKERTK